MQSSENFALTTSRCGELRDAEIKVSSGENTELKRSPFKAWGSQHIAIRATLTGRNFFLAYFYPSGPFTSIFPKPLPIFSCVGCG